MGHTCETSSRKVVAGQWGVPVFAFTYNGQGLTRHVVIKGYPGGTLYAPSIQTSKLTRSVKYGHLGVRVKIDIPSGCHSTWSKGVLCSCVVLSGNLTGHNRPCLENSGLLSGLKDTSFQPWAVFFFPQLQRGYFVSGQGVLVDL